MFHFLYVIKYLYSVFRLAALKKNGHSNWMKRIARTSPEEELLTAKPPPVSYYLLKIFLFQHFNLFCFIYNSNKINFNLISLSTKQAV